jgi:prevent-host-death family protein
MDWRLAEAKNRFSELVNRALAEGPQRVVRRNDAVIILSSREYEQLIGKKLGFKDFLMGEGPDLEGVDLSRDHSSMRDVGL